MSLTQRLSERLTELEAGHAPVTFADAILVLRLVRRLEEPAEALLARLVALHDAPFSTDGAREIFAEYLRAFAQRAAKERALARRTIGLADHGATTRLTPGARLRIALDERRELGWAWDVEALGEGLEQAREAEDGSNVGQAVFLITARTRGVHELSLVERPAAQPYTTSLRARPRRNARRLRLRVVVE